MNSDRCPTRKAKEHLLPVPFRTEESCAGERLFQGRNIGAAKHPLFGMPPDPDYPGTEAGVPLPPEIFDFSKFRHRSILFLLSLHCAREEPGDEIALNEDVKKDER